jgi:hypothetical protein
LVDDQEILSVEKHTDVIGTIFKNIDKVYLCEFHLELLGINQKRHQLELPLDSKEQENLSHIHSFQLALGALLEDCLSDLPGVPLLFKHDVDHVNQSYCSVLEWLSSSSMEDYLFGCTDVASLEFGHIFNALSHKVHLTLIGKHLSDHVPSQMNF